MTGIGDKQMSSIEQRHAVADIEMEKIRELRAAGGDAAVAEYFLEKSKQQDAEKKQRGRRENKEFTQVYKAGWDRLQSLIRTNPELAKMYAFFAEHMGPDGTIAASRVTLAEALDVSEKTISRQTKALEKMGAIVILKMGNANVYCLNDAEVWKSFDNAKPYAAFRTRTLVGKSENPYVKRRLATLLSGKLPEQKDWLDELDEDPAEHIGVAAE